MKFNRTFIAVIVVLMAVMLLFETNAPNQFNWDDYSQSYKSKQPFGCYVMDSVLQATLPHGYEVVGDNIDKYFDNKPNSEKHTFLFTNSYSEMAYSFDVDLLKLIQEGNNVIIATNYNYYSYDDIDELLGFTVQSLYRESPSKETLSDATHCDTINWCDDDLFGPATYMINPALCQDELALEEPYRILATLKGLKDDFQYGNTIYKQLITVTVAGIRDLGKGKVVVVSMPLLFSNYGFLDNNVRPLALRLLSECADLPVVRYDPTLTSDGYSNERDSGSPLRYLLANRPLRWAFFLALATLVAFVLFSARRRQRVIPVIRSPQNHMMDFVKRIGGIYYQRHDNVDLLIKKYAAFSNDVRAKSMINLDNYDHIDEELQSLSSRTGIPFDELKREITEIWSATYASSVSDERLRQLIDVMNNILHNINI